MQYYGTRLSENISHKGCSISYDTSSSVAATVSTGLADLKETVYGLQLLSLIRLYRFAQYIP